MRPFVEWPDLPADAQLGLERFDVGEAFPDLGTEPVSVDQLAVAIHECERKAIERGLVLVRLDRPWIPFGELPEQTQEGRRRQARYLLARARWTRRS